MTTYEETIRYDETLEVTYKVSDNIDELNTVLDVTIDKHPDNENKTISDIKSNFRDINVFSWTPEENDIGGRYKLKIGTEETLIVEVLPAIPDHTVAHYDASQLSLDDGDTVSVWPDEQGDNDLDTQIGSPTYVESGINGNPAIAFDGDGLEVAGLSVTQPNTTYVVFEFHSGWDDSRVLSGVSERQLTAWASPQGDKWGTHAGDNLFGSDDLGIQQMTAVFDGANSSIRENGVETGVGDPEAEDLGGLSVGYDAWKDGYYADAYVSEIVIVNSGSVDLDFETHLLEKWGITA
jgi:hypothetical protein